MRKVLFLSHANPYDNEFTVWLASRLQLMGYEVWCDVKGLIGGEKQWEVIDNIIRNHSVKFLLVVSKDICIKPGQLRDGVSKEFHLAESIAKKLGTDYIIPLKVDKEVAYDEFIGLNRYNHIPFHENWAKGLKALVAKLEKDKVPTALPEKNKSLAEWYNNEFTTKYGLVEKQEKFFTNWWPIQEMWDSFEVYQYENEEIADEIRKINTSVPVIRHGNTIATFGNAELTITKASPIGPYGETYLENLTINTEDVLSKSYVSDSFPTQQDCENILKRLLKRAFHLMAREKGLFWYELSSRKLCYFYPRGRKDKVSYQYAGKKKTKNLIGNFKITDDRHGYWHYGVTVNVIFSPFPSYVFKSHLLFSDDGFSIWTDKGKLHSARRRKGRMWFNEEWRDILLAFVHSLKDENEQILIRLNDQCLIDMPTETQTLRSDMGYDEPTSKDRQSILSEDLNEELEEDEKEV